MTATCSSPTTQAWPDDPISDGRLPGIVARRDPGRSEDHRRAPQGRARAGTASTRRRGRPDEPGDTDGQVAAWIPAVRSGSACAAGSPTRPIRTSEFAKLATLDQEGRSSAMTVIATSILRALRDVPADELHAEARKLLTFVDNRQDASLQAGHLNDFVQVVQLRGALHRAVAEAGRERPRSARRSAAAVADALGPGARQDYAQAPEVAGPAAARRGAPRGHRVPGAARPQRGWRVTLPNLEQTGLLADPTTRCAADARSSGRPVGTTRIRCCEAPTPASGRRSCHVLLDEFRRVLAIDVDAL